MHGVDQDGEPLCPHKHAREKEACEQRKGHRSDGYYSHDLRLEELGAVSHHTVASRPRGRHRMLPPSPPPGSWEVMIRIIVQGSAI